MSRWRRFFSRRKSMMENLDQDIHDFLERETQDNIERGMPPEEARYAAVRKFGSVTRVKEDTREVWSFVWLEQIWQDVRYGLRQLRLSPGFTVVAVLTLALGIGANTAIFSFLDQLLLRPLPFPRSDRLVCPYYRNPRSSDVYNSISFPDYVYHRDHTATFAELAAFGDVDVAFRLGDQRVRLPGEIVSSNYFSVLGVSPFRGRWFQPDEDAVPGRNLVVVLGYPLWQQAFGSDPGVVGRQVVINGASFTVIGIAPRNFAGWRLDLASKPEFWVPIMTYPVTVAEQAGQDLQHLVGDQWLSAIGRLKDGVTMAQAQADFSYRREQLKRTIWRDVWKGDEIMQSVGMLIPASQARIDPGARTTIRTFLLMLVAATGFVLLIACANVASLMLSRAFRRQSEMGVRLALGAGRARVFRQLLTESLLITFMGGGAGLMLATAAARFLGTVHQPFHIPLLLEPRLDFRMLIFTFMLACLIALLFGVAPLRQSSRSDLLPVLKGDSGSPTGRSRLGAHQFLITVQVAFSLVLLIGAVLFVRTLRNAVAADATRDPGRVLLMSLDLGERKYDEKRGKQFFSELLTRVHGLPGVRSAALVLVVPMGGRRGGNDITVHPGDKPVQVDFNIVSEEYFQTVGLPLVRGRGFNAGDRDGSPAVAIVNEQLAKKFWPGEEPLGKQIGLEYPNRMAEIVGVVRDGRFRNYRAEIHPCYYLPYSQDYDGTMSLEVRAAGNPMRLITPVREQIRALDDELVPGDAWTLESFRDAGLGQERSSAALLSGFGLLAVALAGIGLYGVLAVAVVRRTHEIGIRMALGANRSKILRLVTRQAMIPTLCGLAVGTICALSLTRLVASSLYGVRPTDPLAFAGSAAFITLVELVATYMPARRATKVDPMVALRHE